MSLLPELQEKVDNAGADGMQGLHHMILGPSPSGKTTQAREYVTALQDKGMQIGPMTFVNAADWKSWSDFQQLGDALKKAKGGALVIDELEKASDQMLRSTVSQIMLATTNNDTLVIVTGQPSLTSLFQLDTELEKRLGKPVVLTHKLTRDEMEEYTAQQSAKDNARREEVLATQQRVAEWRDARDEDLRPRTTFAAPKTARFRKPQVTS